MRICHTRNGHFRIKTPILIPPFPKIKIMVGTNPTTWLRVVMAVGPIGDGTQTSYVYSYYSFDPTTGLPALLLSILRRPPSPPPAHRICTLTSPRILQT
uniref:Uncharacterized protein n=1 Tax=viral metagenome TaxID=1070528 RepID=A0A6C0K2V8_9ZZZZ